MLNEGWYKCVTLTVLRLASRLWPRHSPHKSTILNFPPGENDEGAQSTRWHFHLNECVFQHYSTEWKIDWVQSCEVNHQQRYMMLPFCDLVPCNCIFVRGLLLFKKKKKNFPWCLCVANLNKLLAFLISADVVFSCRPEHLGRWTCRHICLQPPHSHRLVNLLTKWSRKCSVCQWLYFCPSLDENQFHAICEIHHCRGSGMLSLWMQKEVRRFGHVEGG